MSEIKARKEAMRVNGTFNDPRDGKVYKTVRIGNQVWMAENLNYDAPAGSKCYDNDPKNAEKYGRLYDWNTAMNVAPPGWHLPTDAEWQTLVDFAGGDEVAGAKLKAKSEWKEDGNGTDEYGFSALPGSDGYCDGVFPIDGDYGYWWSASENGSSRAYYRDMEYDNGGVGRDNDDKTHLLSVRYVQDNGEPKRI